MTSNHRKLSECSTLEEVGYGRYPYRLEGLILGDLQHIWGTRTGSQICQDLSQM